MLSLTQPSTSASPPASTDPLQLRFRVVLETGSGIRLRRRLRSINMVWSSTDHS
jgi:hypothetical protein